MSTADLTELARMTGDRGRGKLNWLSRIRNQKMLAKSNGEEISDEEARRRAVATLHRPKLKRLFNDPRLYDGTEVVLSQGRVALSNCVPLEPVAVHAKRKYDKITTEAARMIEEGKVQPEEIRFMCGEFFVYVRNGEDFLVRFGERTIPYRIDKGKLRVNYENGTVTLKGYSTIRVKSVAVFDYYFTLYGALC